MFALLLALLAVVLSGVAPRVMARLVSYRRAPRAALVAWQAVSAIPADQRLGSPGTVGRKHPAPTKDLAGRALGVAVVRRHGEQVYARRARRELVTGGQRGLARGLGVVVAVDAAARGVEEVELRV